MPRYYFDIHTNGTVDVDDVGQICQNLGQAHREAILAVAEIAAEKIPRNGTLEIKIIVRNETNQTVLQTTVKFEPGTELG